MVCAGTRAVREAVLLTPGEGGEPSQPQCIPVSSSSCDIQVGVTLQPLATSVHRAYTADLDADDFYRMLRLRVDVFVVEQECPYPELDGRDLESTTRHFWIDAANDHVLGYLRLLEEPDETFRIGRVCTSGAARSMGLGGKLMRAAVAEVRNSPVTLSAQAAARGFYRSFGFAEVGEEYLEDGIPHFDMRRDPGSQA